MSRAMRLHASDLRSEGHGALASTSGGPFRPARIAGVQLLSQDRPLTGRGAEIAWKLLWYGRWVEAGQHVERDGNRML
jgi:hypothetical protein